jgi:hypothetical protein
MLNEKKIKKEEELWAAKKDLIKRQQKIDEEKKELHKKKKITTTKLLILFLFINCTIIELFTGWTVVQSLQLAKYTNLAPDFSPLTTLIGVTIGEIFSFAIYALKSTKENTKNGITYDIAMKQFEINNNNDNIVG